MYVIQRAGDLKFVARTEILASGSSYTRYLQYARVYRTREDAMNDKCGDESIFSVEDCLFGKDW